MTRDELKVWLDRKCHAIGPAWVDWFDDNAEYLGERSARTGPDPIQTDQKCDCNQCKGAHNEG